MERAPPPNALVQVERVFRDFRARRNALVKALTDDADVFYEQCGPDAEETLCLFGDNDEQWRVEPPAEIVPAYLPEPALGINWVRDTMPKTQWLYLVAKHGDAWLRGVASFEGSKLGFRQVHREQLFDMIEELPTLYEAVQDYYYFRFLMPAAVMIDELPTVPEVLEEDIKERKRKISLLVRIPIKKIEGDKSCKICGEKELWVRCNTCRDWFHGKCVNISSSASLDDYTCRSCCTPSSQVLLLDRLLGDS